MCCTSTFEVESRGKTAYYGKTYKVGLVIFEINGIFNIYSKLELEIRFQ